MYTVGQVAQICKVAPRTVSKWLDSGRLKGYRIPGSQDQRIPREYLIKFLKEHGMPLGDLEDDHLAKVLIFSEDNVLVEYIKKELSLEKGFKVRSTKTSFEAGILVESFHPDAILIDFSIGKNEAIDFCKNLRRQSDLSEVILIALLLEDLMNNFVRPLVNETFIQPLDVSNLSERLQTLVGAKKELT